jgi:hypothetical protein
MTKEQYYEMCEQLGTEPDESELPVEIEDFYPEVQLLLSIYGILRDEWEYVGGNYLGKNLNGILDLFDVYEIEAEDKRLYLQIIHILDNVRIEEIRQKQKQQEKPAKT